MKKLIKNWVRKVVSTLRRRRPRFARRPPHRGRGTTAVWVTGRSSLALSPWPLCTRSAASCRRCPWRTLTWLPGRSQCGVPALLIVSALPSWALLSGWCGLVKRPPSQTLMKAERPWFERGEISFLALQGHLSHVFCSSASDIRWLEVVRWRGEFPWTWHLVIQFPTKNGEF